MSRRYFGTDGIRAVAGVAPLTAGWVLNLGRAAAEVFKHNCPHPTVVIGKDTRHSGDMLEAALAAGLTAQGVHVMHLGVIPTPGVSYLTRTLGADAGVVISASHNPYQDNGIKFFGSNGEKLSDELEAQIELQLAQVDSLTFTTGIHMGSVTNYTDAERIYSGFLLQQAPTLSGLKIVLDCANGAAYRIAPKVFQKMGADVFAIYTNPDGRNINRDCGSTSLSHLKQIVSEGEYHLGVAFDGDADRVLFVDSKGRTLSGDHMLYLLARSRGESAVVTTLMANMGLEVALGHLGISLERTAVGDRYVHERLIERNLCLGGEQSGHILMTDLSPTGDGILSALRVLAALSQLGITLDELYDELPMFPQTLVNVWTRDKHNMAQHPEVMRAISEAEQALKGRGRINLRPSGTEPLVRVMVEGENEAEIQQWAQRVAEAIRRVSTEAVAHP